MKVLALIEGFVQEVRTWTTPREGSKEVSSIILETKKGSQKIIERKRFVTPKI